MYVIWCSFLTFAKIVTSFGTPTRYSGVQGWRRVARIRICPIWPNPTKIREIVHFGGYTQLDRSPSSGGVRSSYLDVFRTLIWFSIFFRKNIFGKFLVEKNIINVSKKWEKTVSQGFSNSFEKNPDFFRKYFWKNIFSNFFQKSIYKVLKHPPGVHGIDFEPDRSKTVASNLRTAILAESVQSGSPNCQFSMEI